MPKNEYTKKDRIALTKLFSDWCEEHKQEFDDAMKDYVDELTGKKPKHPMWVSIENELNSPNKKGIV